jgi:hypothetical protein
MNINPIEDLNKLSLSEDTHAKLQTLKEKKQFLEMKDAYRLGIALALSRKIVPDEIKPPKASGIYSVSQIDPDKSIALAITILMDTGNIPPYRWLERLAEWGIEELYKLWEKGELDIVRLLNEANE